MSEPQWKPGDVVALKSGGPLMTVGYVGERGVVTCTWFVGQEVRQSDFKADQLDRADPKTGRVQGVSI